jgi:hypothetical protein
MDNVQFQCGHCGSLMAVSPDLLGQQVHCPNCQEVVLAPAPADEAPTRTAPPVEEPPVPQSSLPGISETESIFAPPEADSDALFDLPPRGLVEIPTDPSPQLFSEPTPPPPAPATNPLDQIATFAPDGGAPASAVEAPPEPIASTTTFAPESPTPATTISPLTVRKSTDKGGWIVVLVIIPLISYSVLATIAVLYLRFHQPPHPLETIPDLEGENPGVKRVKKRVSVNFNGRQEKKLPPSLRTTLGETKRIGALEVTPTSVELRKVVFLMPGREPEPSGDDSLVLHLHLKNVSKDQAFYPMDPYFVRAWHEVPGETKTGMPFTYLEVGKERFYGGAIGEEEREERQESLRGQNLEHELMPGEEMDTFVCTDPTQSIKKALARTSQSLLWRVQVRRGLVDTPNRGELPATAVIGVRFTRDDIESAEAGD